MRQTAAFPFDDLAILKQRLLAWASAQPVAVYLDSNEYGGGPHSSWECLVGSGVSAAVEAGAGGAFEAFRKFYDAHPDWLFGFFGYDLKNEVEALQSRNFDGVRFPDLYFFCPEIVLGIQDGALKIESLTSPPSVILDQLQNTPIPPDPAHRSPLPSRLSARFPRTDYLATVDAIRGHIVEGDVYELNLCQEFFAENLRLDPVEVFRRLNARARAPFSAFLRLNDRYLLCASPERFLCREGDRLISQPIKGTRRRGATPEEDARIRAELASSEKDRAENVMIVDLVRNDLARHCRPGTVEVEELFGIHAFETVLQMISTISGRLRPDGHPIDALRDAFPMGSMTGAPKVMAMELIERYERSRRGLYSGAAGYFAPDRNFDFNVVIRSILYNGATGYASVQVGGAIVYDSVPEDEYAECLLKAQAMFGALGG
jgi:para-aminobenzoate synthetase component 1